VSEIAPEHAPDAGLDQRVTSLEHGQVSILGKLDQLLSLGGPKEPEAEAERPEVNIAEEIRRQLAERDRKAKDKPAETPAPAKTELAEQAPVAPVRRLTKLMWGDE
jgi:hypothetical protein